MAEDEKPWTLREIRDDLAAIAERRGAEAKSSVSPHRHYVKGIAVGVAGAVQQLDRLLATQQPTTRKAWRELGQERDATTKALFDQVFAEARRSTVWNALERALHGPMPPTPTTEDEND